LAQPNAFRLQFHMAKPAPLSLRPPMRTISPLATVAYAADTGAYAGLALGFLGDILGLWSDKTTLGLLGAGAALGAAWGGTFGMGNLEFRVRPDWDKLP